MDEDVFATFSPCATSTFAEIPRSEMPAGTRRRSCSATTAS